MTCIDDGRLRAWLDHELAEDQGADLANHLETCAHCRERLDALRQSTVFTAHHLGPDHEPQEESAQTEAALGRFRLRQQQESVLDPPRRIAWRPALAAAAALVMIVGIASTSAGRAWAEHVLAMLRIEKVTAVPVDFSALSSPEGRNAGEMLARLLNSDLVVTMKPQKPQPVADQAAAAQAAGFDVRLPMDANTPPQLSVGGETAFQITLHRQRLQAILNEAGRPDLQLPANLDHALIAVHIPRSVVARYGSCPAPGGHHEKQPPSPPRAYPGCTILMQVPSPTVSVPPGLNLQQLATIGLELTGMSASTAEAYTRTVDWTSTLVIPVPERVALSESVSVDGQQGVLIRRAGRNQPGPDYQLVWTRHGMIYAIGGWGDPAAALAMADTLQ